MSASSNNIEGKLDVHVAHKINWLLSNWLLQLEMNWSHRYEFLCYRYEFLNRFYGF